MAQFTTPFSGKYTGTITSTELSASFLSTDIFAATVSTNTTADCATYNIFSYTLDDSIELTGSNPVAGASYLFFLTQDGAGAREVTWSSHFLWAGGTAPTLSTDGAAVDIITGISDGTSIYAAASLDFKS